MKILVIGSGGREHALVWKVARSPNVTEIFVAPGNAGTSLEPRASNIDIGSDQTDALLKFANEQNIDLTIVGPEVPLVNGIVDAFEEAGLAIFGPRAAAAQLEGSKAFSKAFLERHAIPTAGFEVFSSADEAMAYLDSRVAPIVIKADGLAAGKGVVVAQTLQEARDAVKDMLSGNAFGAAGHRVVIEDFLSGEEASFICMVDGTDVLPLASSQDHKARDAGDTGPNTGGMGAYSPAPVVTSDVHEHIMRDIIMPTVQGMHAEDASFRGFLYAGLMIENGKARVIEFNVRLGDPETQPLLTRMNSDLVPLCMAAINGDLATQSIDWKDEVAVGVVMAAGGYPGDYEKGVVITGLNNANQMGCKVFHAGTRDDNGNIVTSGGRVLCVVGSGESTASAQKSAYNGVKNIDWAGVYYREDIAYRAVARESEPA